MGQAASVLASAAILIGLWRARRAPLMAPPATTPPPDGSAPPSDEGGPGQNGPDAPENIFGRADALQRRMPGLSFLMAVLKKYGDDGGGRLVAQMTYSSFLSLFPLLLVLTTVLGFVLAERPDLQERLLDSALVQFPIIGDQIGSNVGSLKGSGMALAIGIVTAVWGGLRVSQAAQDILSTVWMVPRRHRPSLLPRLGRAGVVLFVLLGGIASTAGITALGATWSDSGWVGRAGLLMMSVAVNTLWFALGFKILMAVKVPWSVTWPGSLAAAFGSQILLLVGATLVDRQLRGATQSYGFFGIVLGLLAWLALLATVLVFAAEINAVHAHRLWPRSLMTPGLTEHDRRALTATAQIEERAPGERVAVTFGAS